MDWNGDGMLDLIVGNYHPGYVDYYQAVDVTTSPILTYAGHLQAGGSDIAPDYHSAPVVCDWNEDGLQDLLLGWRGYIIPPAPYDTTATVWLYLNSGTPSVPVLNDYSLVEAAGDSITVMYCWPDVGDADGDGKKDLVIGSIGGHILFYRNEGTNANPILASGYQLRYNFGADTIYSSEGYTRPLLEDWNQDGRMDLIRGGGDGMLLVYWGYQPTPVSDHGLESICESELSVSGNPCLGSLKLQLDLSCSQEIDLCILSIDGRTVEVQHEGFLDCGEHQLVTDLSSLPDGIYYASILADGKRITQPFVLAR